MKKLAALAVFGVILGSFSACKTEVEVDEAAGARDLSYSRTESTKTRTIDSDFDAGGAYVRSETTTSGTYSSGY